MGLRLHPGKPEKRVNSGVSAEKQANEGDFYSVPFCLALFFF